ncbi:Mitomycin radical oxidase [Mycolicibacterium vanbaalenii]|uniref:Mitomycin radical oxidase n=1 Tax=Mycolicibacterium vanbaalenii TaxID=110539 RepID=A0A5S9PCR0_MYCVN|nr:FAD-binding protein [Mycolicibacterium vanbaalenii]CAA0101712.1 Mitomycin radical oxidase [Mycolicibacterium vanbaalenii]
MADHWGASGISRRGFLAGASTFALVSAACSPSDGGGTASTSATPVDGLPTEAEWAALREEVGGRLINVESPLTSCTADMTSDDCSSVLENLRNPFWIEEQPGVSQTTGWLGAWQNQVSLYAVAAESADDIAAAVNFARDKRVRLAVKGTGHDYLGRSNAPDSLLVWTQNMREVTFHPEFRPAGADAARPPVSALSVAAGARWLEAYQEATANGVYVQGGGCTSVGACGGFTLGGGFGNFSKRFGSGAGGVLEMEVVTADGQVRIVNEAQDADLFWALRGGGGGTFGIVSRITYLAHPIPQTVGSLSGTITASGDDAFKDLLGRFVRFFPGALIDGSWGEQIAVKPDNSLELSVVWLDLTTEQARAVWEPFTSELQADGLATVDLDFESHPFRDLWNTAYWQRVAPETITLDPRPDQPSGQFWWASNQGEVSQFIFSYLSRWLPLKMFVDTPDDLVDALFEASRLARVSIHINKGLAGASEEVLARERTTSINPACLAAAAFATIGSQQPTAYPGIVGHEPDLTVGRKAAEQTNAAIGIIRDATPGAGTYFNEADYFEPDWQHAFWGTNYDRLLSIKRNVDPDNLFRVHNGVGSE